MQRDKECLERNRSEIEKYPDYYAEVKNESGVSHNKGVESLVRTYRRRDSSALSSK